MRFVAALFVLLGGALARATPADEADALFRLARSLVVEKNFVAACPLFERSHQLEPALGTLLNWADCLENTGREIESFHAFTSAQGWAEQTGDSRRHQEARRRAELLRARLVFLRLELAQADAHIELTAVDDGAVVPTSTAAAQSGYTLRPAVYQLKVTAPRYKRLERRLELTRPGETTTLVVALEAEPEPAPMATHAPTTAPETRSPFGLIGVGGGSVLALAALVGVVYSQAVVTRADRQRTGGPDEANPTVTRAEFQTVQVLYPVSIGGAVLAIAAIVGGSMVLRGPALTVSVLPTVGGATALLSVSLP